MTMKKNLIAMWAGAATGLLVMFIVALLKG